MKHIALPAVAALLPSALLAQERPNIVFAFGDDYGRYASAYAALDRHDGLSALVNTPNFDRIAREGVLFTQAYAPAPSSTPCRSSLCSGQYFWRTGYGAFLQGARWDDSIPTFPLILEANGYHIGFTYKVWSPGDPVDQPYGGARTRFMSAGRRWNGYSEIVGKAADHDGMREQLLAEVEANFASFLKTCDDGAPFCYWWGPTNTHRSWLRGSGKELWGIDPDRLKGRMPAFFPDTPEVREDVADYLGECLAFDQGLGVLIRMLEERGVLDNTIIVVSGDHGIPGFPRGKCNLYALGTHVGMAVRYPKTVKPGRVVDDFVSLMDLAPTFLEFGQAPVPEVMTGRSFKNVLESGRSGKVDPARDYVVVGRERHVRGARHDNLPYPQRAIVTERYTYIRNFEPTRWPMGTYKAEFRDMDGGPTKTWMMEHYFDPEWSWYMDLAFAPRLYEELYDNKKDPDQTVNLARSARHQKVLAELSARLDAILTETGDPRMAPGLCVYDSPEFVGLIRPDKPANSFFDPSDREHPSGR
ncbi:MAG: sulfatase [Bacteroidales bacterium]|nr:sulfatase [Bacteroidales bacterium]